MKMYTKKLFLGTSILTLAIVAVSKVSLNKVEGSYSQTGLNSVQSKTNAGGADEYWRLKSIDNETGLPMTAEKRKIQKDIFMQRSQNKTTFPLEFIEKGPDNIGGRTRAIVIDRGDVNKMFAGSVTGGLYKSTNAGNTWSRVLNFPGSVTISSATQTADGKIFIATGVSFEAEPQSNRGDGIYYTADFGDSWILVPGTSNLDVVRDVVAQESGASTIWIGGSGPLRKWTVGDASLSNASTNGITTGSSSTGDLSISVDGSVLMCEFATGKHYISTDAGLNWTNVTASTPTSLLKPTSSTGRTEYAISKTKINGFYHIYVALVTSSGTGKGTYKSFDHGATWARIFGSTTGVPGDPYNIYAVQGKYNSCITVVPNNPKKIFLGGLDVWTWTESNVANAGQLDQKSNWFSNPTSPNYVHADNHEFKWASDTKLYIGNDGGVGISENAGQSFYPANRGYNVTQFYSISFGPDGEVIGGAQDNGTLYNDYSNYTLESFKEVSGGDGTYTEISYFNKNILFATSQYGTLRRSGDAGVSFGSIEPPYPSTYPTTGEQLGGATHPFVTNVKLAEYYDTSSKDSVIFVGGENISASVASPVSRTVNSATTGKIITFDLKQNVYWSDTVSFQPSLTIKDWKIITTPTGPNLEPLEFYLSEIIGLTAPTTGWNLIPGAGGLRPVSDLPAPGESGSIFTVTSGPLAGTYQVSSVTADINGINHYFGQQLNGGILQTLDLEGQTFKTNYTWNKVKVADPYQSIFMIKTFANGGELWATKDALRLSSPKMAWGRIGINLGIGDYDIEISEDLNHVFVCAGSKITRISGLRNIYTQDNNFLSSFAYTAPSVVGDPLIPPTGTSFETAIGSYSAISIDHRDPNFLVAGSGSNGQVKKCTTATTSLSSGTLINLGPAANAQINDILVDRNNRNLILVGTDFGLLASNTAVPVWVDCSQGFLGTPVTKIKQQWRTNNEGVSRGGEIYIGTFGRGIFASSSVLGLGDKNESEANNDAKQDVLNVYPNPTSNTSAIRFDLKESGKVTINIYSINGSLVHTLTTDNLESGVQNIDLNISDLQNGNYIVKAIGKANSATGRLVKM